MKLTCGDNIMSKALQVFCYWKLLWCHQRENAQCLHCAVEYCYWTWRNTSYF